MNLSFKQETKIVNSFYTFKNPKKRAALLTFFN